MSFLRKDPIVGFYLIFQAVDFTGTKSTFFYEVTKTILPFEFLKELVNVELL